MISEPFNPETEFKKFHESERKNYKSERLQKRPSKIFLKQFAGKILDVANKWQSMNDNSLTEVIATSHSIDIFLADLDSDLELNNDEKYKIEWNKKHDKLKNIQLDFLKGYFENISKLL
jgi:hypothetical protein